MAREPATPVIFSRLTEGYIALLLSLFLLWPGRGGYAAITMEKFRLFLLLTTIYTAGMLILMLELWLVGRWRPPVLRTLWVKAALPQKLILLFWLWSGISTLCSPYRQTAFYGTGRLDGFASLSLYCLLFLLVSIFGRPAKWQLWVFGISMSLCCGLALVQLAGYNPLTLYPAGMTYYDGFVLYAGQFLGTIGNVDLLAAVLCVAIPLFWVSLLRLYDPKRFLLLIPLLLCLAVLLLSRVEAGFVGVFGGAVLTFPVVANVSRQSRKRLVIGAGGVILLALVFIYCWGSHLPGFLYELSELLHGRWDDRFGSSRLYIWRNVLPLLADRPLLGGGPDTLGLRCQLQFERFNEELGVLLTSLVDNAHNEYLNIALNQGIPALLFYLGALFSAAARWVKNAPTNPPCAILGATVLGYCMQAFFGLPSVISTPYLWLAFALMLCADRTPASIPSKRRNKT